MKSNKMSALLAVLVAGLAIAAPAEARNWGDVAAGMNGQFQQGIPLAGSILFLLGIITGGVGVYKLKQHKDDPRQTPMSTPIWYLLCAVLLVFLPDVFDISGESVLGGKGKSQGATGAGMTQIGQ